MKILRAVLLVLLAPVVLGFLFCMSCLVIALIYAAGCAPVSPRQPIQIPICSQEVHAYVTCPDHLFGATRCAQCWRSSIYSSSDSDMIQRCYSYDEDVWCSGDGFCSDCDPSPIPVRGRKRR